MEDSESWKGEGQLLLRELKVLHHFCEDISQKNPTILAEGYAKTREGGKPRWSYLCDGAVVAKILGVILPHSAAAALDLLSDLETTGSEQETEEEFSPAR